MSLDRVNLFLVQLGDNSIGINKDAFTLMLKRHPRLS